MTVDYFSICRSDELINIIDYTKDVDIVYRKIAEHIISTENTLQLLCYKEGSLDASNLPSWVPDWSSQKLFPFNHLFLPKDRDRGFDRTQGANKSKEQPTDALSTAPICSFDPIRNALSVKGFILDSIAELSSTWVKDSWEPDDKLYAEWAMLVTNGQASEINTTIERRKTYRPGYDSFNFWSRLGHSGRLRTSDKPFGTTNPSDHPLYTTWKNSRYHWKNRRIIEMSRSLIRGFNFINSWGFLSRSLPIASIGRRLARTSCNYITLLPAETMIGDFICYLDGGGIIPFVLRKDRSGYRLIGACYVHGFFTPGTIWNKAKKQEFVIY